MVLPKDPSKIEAYLKNQREKHLGKPGPRKGQLHTESAKQKMREARLGKSSWIKGKHFSEDSRKKMSLAKKGKVMSDDFRKTRSQIMKERWKDPQYREEMITKRKNIKRHPMSDKQKEKLKIIASNRSDTWRQKQSESHKGHKSSEETKKKMSVSHAGEKCHNWKGGITPLHKHIRACRLYKEWCKQVLIAGNYTDRFSGKKGKRFVCHHIITVSKIIEMCSLKTFKDALSCKILWDINNGIVMEKNPHAKFHDIYGDSLNISLLSQKQIEELYTLDKNELSSKRKTSMKQCEFTKENEEWVCIGCEKRCRAETGGKGKPLERCLVYNSHETQFIKET
jgi:hypothetical protein